MENSHSYSRKQIWHGILLLLLSTSLPSSSSSFVLMSHQAPRNSTTFIRAKMQREQAKRTHIRVCWDVWGSQEIMRYSLYGFLIKCTHHNANAEDECCRETKTFLCFSYSSSLSVFWSTINSPSDGSSSTKTTIRVERGKMFFFSFFIFTTKPNSELLSSENETYQRLQNVLRCLDNSNGREGRKCREKKTW